MKSYKVLEDSLVAVRKGATVTLDDEQAKALGKRVEPIEAVETPEELIEEVERVEPIEAVETPVKTSKKK